ncbi:MAG TPA: prephenate dehydratase [Candidatus Limnocylindrales bacterium]|nr:prephenate dehydratase [Candidatus Limnocylindrales bacterium]
MTDLPVAFAGEPGAFAEDAVMAAFGAADRLALGSFREVFEAVSDGRARAGLVPIENVVGGSVREVYDLLLDHDLEIVGEVEVPVELCLAALPGQTLEDIVRVYSHVQALAQAEAFLRSRPWATLTTYNTAGAGRLIRDAGELRAAAVLSPRAAATFGLEVLAGSIEDRADNRTRFIVVAHPAPGPRRTSPGRMRTTVAFAVANEPGALLAALRAFAEQGVNLSKLESRPSRTAAWEYVFWADLDAEAGDPGAAAAIAALRSVSTMVRVLGSYPQAEPAG